MILLDLDFFKPKKKTKQPKAFHTDHEFKLFLKDKLVLKFALQQVKRQNKVTIISVPSFALVGPEKIVQTNAAF